MLGFQITLLIVGAVILYISIADIFEMLNKKTQRK